MTLQRGQLICICKFDYQSRISAQIQRGLAPLSVHMCSCLCVNQNYILRLVLFFGGKSIICNWCFGLFDNIFTIYIYSFLLENHRHVECHRLISDI